MSDVYARCRVCDTAYLVLPVDAEDAHGCGRCGSPNGTLDRLAEKPIDCARYGRADLRVSLPDEEIARLRDAWQRRQDMREDAVDEAIALEYCDAPPRFGMRMPESSDALCQRVAFAANAFPFLGRRLGNPPAGWTVTVERACVEIALRPEECLSLETLDLKEKFGVLAWYLGGDTRRITEIVGDAKERSASTCACCGVGPERGTRLRGHADGRIWGLTLCDRCHALDDEEIMRGMYPGHERRR